MTTEKIFPHKIITNERKILKDELEKERAALRSNIKFEEINHKFKTTPASLRYAL